MIIEANWPIRDKVTAFTTTRINGMSKPPFDSFNLALHAGDDKHHVIQNRQLLIQQYRLPAKPYWLSQIHSNIAIEVNYQRLLAEADASFTHQQNAICAILTADCLPILMSNQSATVVAGIHAGWKSLASGIIDKTIKKLQVPTQEIFAWLGPAISKAHFEVGHDVFKAFKTNGFNVANNFKKKSDNKWHADLCGLAKDNLQRLGITAIYGGEHCTYSEKDLFYSYRRDKITGRMASLIWIK